jgi:hypothetical protein
MLRALTTVRANVQSTVESQRWRDSDLLLLMFKKVPSQKICSDHNRRDSMHHGRNEAVQMSLMHLSGTFPHQVGHNASTDRRN